MPDVSASEPNWSRERPRGFWDPSRKMLRALRDYQKHEARGRRGGPLRRLAVLRHRFWSAVAGCEVPINTRLGGGFMLPHPVGVVIHPDAVVGPNCLLMQNATLGGNRDGGAPTLGGHVDVGPGAQVLGGVSLGDHAVVGANAVVLRDVPPGALAVGVPATIRDAARPARRGPAGDVAEGVAQSVAGTGG